MTLRGLKQHYAPIEIRIKMAITCLAARIVMRTGSFILTLLLASECILLRSGCNNYLCLKAGMNLHLGKPVILREVVDAMEQLTPLRVRNS